MALGEKVIFDINRFKLHFEDPNAICVACRKTEQIMHLIKICANNRIRIPDYFNEEYIYDQLYKMRDWVTVYCSDGSLSISTDCDIDFMECESDYYYEDIIFNCIDISISSEDVLKFIS